MGKLKVTVIFKSNIQQPVIQDIWVCWYQNLTIFSLTAEKDEWWQQLWTTCKSFALNCSS